jgi:hypothetical protein
MSKLSKPADRWRQLYQDAHGRDPLWCNGCGYYRKTRGQHRKDCTADPDKRV